MGVSPEEGTAGKSGGSGGGGLFGGKSGYRLTPSLLEEVLNEKKMVSEEGKIYCIFVGRAGRCRPNNDSYSG